MKFDTNKYLMFQKNSSEFYLKEQLKVIDGTDITKPEADVLVFLANHSFHNTAADIVKYRGFSKAYVSKAVELLVSKKYILSKVDREDRRYIRLFLEDKSKVLVRKLIGVQERFGEILFKDIDVEDKNLFFRIFNDMIDNLHSYNKGDGDENS